MTINIKNVTDAPLYALSANYPYDTKLQIINSVNQFSDGYTSVASPIFQNTKDVNSAKDSTFYLTSSMNLFDFVSEISNTVGITDLVIYTSFLAYNGKYWSDNSDVLYANADVVGENEFFRLEKTSDNSIKIYNSNFKLATVDRDAPWNITFEDAIVNDPYNQQSFDFILEDDTVYFSTKFTTNESFGPTIIKRFLSHSPISYNVRGIGLINYNTYVLTFDNTYISSLTTGFNAKIKWVKYYNDLDNKQYNKTVDVKQTIEGIRQNYLIDLPYKTKIEIDTNNKVGKMDINVATLKNVKTPEYEYTKSSYILDNTISSLSSDQVKRREYEKIFLGTNQSDGYEIPYFEFESNTKELILPTDKTTYFHYPRTAPQIALSASGLIESGANAGLVPHISDRIYKKMANYSRNIWWGDSNTWQRGTWLCSWLSGTNEPVWKDRWYNAGYITASIAITATEPQFIENNPVVWDEDSSMAFDPGVWYKYVHLGPINNSIFVNTLTANDALKLHYDSIEIYDGSTETILPYTTGYNLEDKISYSTWIKVNNWENVKGNHIISNGIRGGWNIAYNNGFFTPLFPICETTYGHVLFVNNNFKTFIDKTLPNDGKPIAITVDNDAYTWIVDGVYNNLYKIDYNGDILEQVGLGVSVVSSLQIDGNNNIYVMDSTTGIASAYNVYSLSCVYISDSDSNRKAFTIDLNNTFVASSADKIVVDNTNGIWSLTNNTLLSGSEVVFSQNTIEDFTIDKNNNPWVLYNTDRFAKLRNDGQYTGNVLLSGIIPDQNSADIRHISITNEYYDTQYQDFICILQSYNNTVYKYNTNGTLITKYKVTDGIDITKHIAQSKSNMNFINYGDTTGYDRQRKYNYVNNNSQEYITSTIYTGNNLVEDILTLRHPISSMANDTWHNIQVTYDKSTAIANLYVDTVLCNTLTGTVNNPIYYKYESSLVLGANVGRLETLDDELYTDDYHFNGQIDDVRIYDLKLNNSEVTGIYNIKSEYEDMVWNIPTGLQTYIEEVERFFKHKLPGSKSHFYNIKIVGLNITDESIRLVIENIIKDTVSKVAPAYTELYKIIWE